MAVNLYVIGRSIAGEKKSTIYASLFVKMIGPGIQGRKSMEG